MDIEIEIITDTINTAKRTKFQNIDFQLLIKQPNNYPITLHFDTYNKHQHCRLVTFWLSALSAQ